MNTFKNVLIIFFAFNVTCALVSLLSCTKKEAMRVYENRIK